MGFEPTTPTLARLCSTSELRPLCMSVDRIPHMPPVRKENSPLQGFWELLPEAALRRWRMILSASTKQENSIAA